MMISVVGLYVYPIKSCRGIALSDAHLMPGGFEGDRRFMVVASTGDALTARTEPRLLLVAPRLENGSIRVEAPGARTLELSQTYAAPPGAMSHAKIWRDEVSTWEIPEGSRWFSQFLGKEVQLVYQAESALRQVNLAHSDRGDVVSLADAYPLLLANTASLEDLNAKAESLITMERFRPNIVISGAPAYAEDTWQTLRIADIEFVSPKLCDRCVLTTVDPKTAERGREPLRTLAKHRRWDKAVWFATNLISRSSGTLRIGDDVAPLKMRTHPRDSD